MNQGYDGGTLADGAAHTLHRTGTHVSDGEYAGHRGLERGGHMPRSEACGRLTGQHKTVGVERDATTFQPTRFWIRAHKKEHMPDRPFLFDASFIVAPGHRGEACRRIAIKPRELGVRPLLDVRRGVDAVDQIA